MATDDMLHTVSTAARRLTLSEPYIRALLRAGKLQHIRDASGRYLIPEHVLDQFQAQRKSTRVGLFPRSNPVVPSAADQT